MARASTAVTEALVFVGRRLRVPLLAAILATVAILSSASGAAAWDSNSYSLADEQLLFSLTNQARASAGLPVLGNDSYLVGLARWRSKDMIERNYFSHNIPPSGEMVFSYMQRDGYCFVVAGENIGVSTYPDDVATTRIQNAFMNSPEHRSNILGVAWTVMGVGTYKGADGKKIWTVLFSQPCAPATPKPTPVPTPKPTPVPTPKPTAIAPKVTPAPRSTSEVVLPTPEPTAAATPTASNAAPASTPSGLPTDAESQPPASPTTGPSLLAPAAPSWAPTLAPEPATSTVNLRVRPNTRQRGLLDGFFDALFGAIFG